MTESLAHNNLHSFVCFIMNAPLKPEGKKSGTHISYREDEHFQGRKVATECEIPHLAPYFLKNEISILWSIYLMSMCPDDIYKKWSVRMMAFLVTKGTGFFDETLPWNPSLVRQRLIQPAIDGQVLIRNKTKWLQWLTWDTNSWWWSYQLLPEPEVSVMYCLLWNRSARGPWNSGKWSWSTSTPNNLSNVCRKCATHNAL